MFGWWIEQAPEYEAEAERVALARHASARRLNLRNASNPRAQESSDYAKHLLGAMCECAGWQALYPIIWNKCENGPIWGVPDLGDFIDVKGVKRHGYDLGAKVGGIKQHWAYLLVSAQERPRYLLVGWAWGRDLLQAPLKQWDRTRPAMHSLPQADPRIRDVMELEKIVRSKDRKVI